MPWAIAIRYSHLRAEENFDSQQINNNSLCSKGALIHNILALIAWQSKKRLKITHSDCQRSGESTYLLSSDAIIPRFKKCSQQLLESAHRDDELN